MKNSITLKSVLFISGLIAAGIGAGILVVPVAFHAATDGIALGGDISLLNEIRASGGGLLASGALIMSGAFMPKLTYTATVVSVLLYLSYGLSRVYSMTVDGLPTEELVQVAAIEIAIGLACLFSYIKYREKRFT